MYETKWQKRSFSSNTNFLTSNYKKNYLQSEKIFTTYYTNSINCIIKINQ